MSTEILAIWQFLCFSPYFSTRAQKRQFPSVWIQFWRHFIQQPQLLIKVENFISSHFSPFLFAHAHKRRYLYFRSEFCHHRRSQRHRFLIKVPKCWRFDHVFCWFWPHFYGACAETPISELPATILDSVTPISYRNNKFRQSESIFGRFGPFFAHAQNRHYICFRSETSYHRHSHRHRFLINGWKCWRCDNVWDNF